MGLGMEVWNGDLLSSGDLRYKRYGRSERSVRFMRLGDLGDLVNRHSREMFEV